MEIDSQAIGQRIAMLREESAMTQEALGDKLGLTGKHIGRVERGVSNLTLHNYLKVSELFSVSLDYLITGALDKPLNDCVRELVEEGSAEEQEAVWKFLRTLLHLKEKP